MAPQIDPQKVHAVLNAQQRRIDSLTRQLEEVNALMRAAGAAPTTIEQVTGLRVPYLGVITIAIPANSQARAEGSLPVGADGPFVVTGMAAFWYRTSGAYQGQYGPVSTVSSRIAPASQQLGFGGLFDQPIAGNFDFEINVSDSGRNWQNLPFASALFAQEVGGAYVFPVHHMLGINAIIKVYATPKAAQTVSGVIVFHFLGYKLVQGATFQP